MKKGSGKGASLCLWKLEPGGRAPLVGDPEEYVQKGFGDGHISP
jgi:hypothetical protein